MPFFLCRYDDLIAGILFVIVSLDSQLELNSFDVSVGNLRCLSGVRSIWNIVSNSWRYDYYSNRDIFWQVELLSVIAVIFTGNSLQER